MRDFLVTGTDTGIGKTFVACALLHSARALGLTAVGMKPVAAGVQEIDGQNEDAVRLREASSFDPGAALCNPYCLGQPVAPHIAAAEEGVEIDRSRILTAFASLKARTDVVVVEGVGGFRVPLGPTYDTADLAVDLGLPVVLVVGMRLGCINHALLTAEAIAARRLVFAGWIANRIDPQMLRFEENLATLAQRLPGPLLGVVPHSANQDPAAVAACLTLPVGVGYADDEPDRWTE